MRNFRRKNILFYTLLSTCIILFYQFNNIWVAIHENSEVSGCDSFGYARQAQLFRKSSNFLTALDSSIDTDVQSVLNQWGKSTSIKYKDWYQMVSPHAHHFRKDSDKVILQYPPGTGWLLSNFPENKARKILWILSFTVISSLFLARINILYIPLTNINLALSCLGCLYITNTFSTRSDSIAPSCLIAVLITSITIRSINYLNKYHLFPILETLFISFIFGFSLSVRPGNLLFIISPLSILILAILLNIKSIFKFTAFCFSVFCASIVPLLLANKINTGSIFTSTYSSIDTTFDISSFFTNITLVNESFDDSIRVFIVLLFSMIFSYRALIQKENSSFFYSRRILIYLSWISMIFMICLMALKPVFNLYYLAPQLVMTLSISSMSPLITKSFFKSNLFCIDKFRSFSIIFSFLIFIFGYLLIKPTFIESFPSFNQFPRNSIIWSDSIGSKLNYYHNLNTAKFDFGSIEAQKDIIEYLSIHNIDQFVLDEGNLAIKFQKASAGYLQEFSIYQNLKLFKYIPE